MISSRRRNYRVALLTKKWLLIICKVFFPLYVGYNITYITKYYLVFCKQISHEKRTGMTTKDDYIKEILVQRKGESDNLENLPTLRCQIWIFLFLNQDGFPGP